MNHAAKSKLMRLPLYGQVKQQIIESLADKKTGERISTEAEYVQLFGVSITTVRLALRALKEEGWVEKRQGSGTYLCDPAARRRRHVAVLLDVDVTSENLSPYWLKITREIQKALETIGFPVRPYLGDLPLGQEATGLTCQYFLDDVRMGRVKAAVTFFTRRSASWFDLLTEKGIPCLDPDDKKIRRLDALAADLFLRASLSRFRDEGRRMVSALLWESDTDGRHAFSNALHRLAREYGVRVDSRLLDATASGWERGMGWERFRDIWRSGREKPDALIIADDGLFADCQKAILEMGVSVPSDLGVAVRSSDAVDLNPLFPIFNCEIQTQPLARMVANLMKAEIEGKKPSPIEVFPMIQKMAGPVEDKEGAPASAAICSHVS